MATHSTIFAWKIPWTEEPGGLVHGVAKESDMTEHAHTRARAHTHTHIRTMPSMCSLFHIIIISVLIDNDHRLKF